MWIAARKLLDASEQRAKDMIIHVKPGRNKQPVYIYEDGKNEEDIKKDTVGQSIDEFCKFLKYVMLATGIMAVAGFIIVGLNL